MNWIEVNRWQDVPHNGNYIYTIRRADPYTLNHNNGEPKYYVARYADNLDMFESVIAYAEVTPFAPKDEDMDFCRVYVKYSDNIPIENNYKLTWQEKKKYDLGFHDACEKINELLKDLPTETKEQIQKLLDH